MLTVSFDKPMNDIYEVGRPCSSPIHLKYSIICKKCIFILSLKVLAVQ